MADRSLLIPLTRPYAQKNEELTRIECRTAAYMRNEYIYNVFIRERESEECVCIPSLKGGKRGTNCELTCERTWSLRKFGFMRAPSRRVGPADDDAEEVEDCAIIYVRLGGRAGRFFGSCGLEADSVRAARVAVS